MCCRACLEYLERKTMELLSISVRKPPQNIINQNQNMEETQGPTQQVKIQSAHRAW